MRKFTANIETKSATLATAPPFEQHAYDPQFCKVGIVVEGEDAATGVVEGYASVFGNIDLGGDIVEQGAFRKTLKERLGSGAIKLVDSHMAFREGTNAIIGVVTEAKEDQYGLWFKAKLSSTARAQEIRKKITEGILNALSFGFDVIKSEPDKGTDGVRRLKELRLYEVSVVGWGMNPKAALTRVKGVVPVSDFSTAANETPWSAAKARASIQEWAALDGRQPADWTDENWARYAKAFLWFDSEEPDSLSSYHFPVATVVDGQLKYVLQGATAALVVIRGGRAQGDGKWNADKPAIEASIAKVYEKFGKQVPDGLIEHSLTDDAFDPEFTALSDPDAEKVARLEKELEAEIRAFLLARNIKLETLRVTTK